MPDDAKLRANIARQQRFWTRRAESWDHGAANNPGLVRVVEKVLEISSPTKEARAVDLGCGSGQLTLSLAGSVHAILGVDVSQQMIDLLLEHARRAGLENVSGTAVPIEHLTMPAHSVELIVSNYALHHLLDSDKAALVRRAAEWLVPGGKLVIGDMMFGRGGEARDREIIVSKILLMARKGPKGWWRIAKNAARFLFRVQERPISAGAWSELLREAGFADVTVVEVINEAAVVTGTMPFS